MTNSPSADLVGPASLILVVEDELIVALDLVATLEEAGHRVLGPAATVVAALKLVGQQRPDAAVLDVSLRDGMVTPVALLLRHMAVPFVVTSAYSRAALPDEVMLGDPPCLGKPTSGAEMLVAVGDLLREGTPERA